jgi:subtilisin family serine protease
LSLLLVCAFAHSASAIQNSVPAVHGDLSRLRLGAGTGVVIGIVDSGIDDLHPTLAGNDSLGMPRLVAEANFVTSEPGNTGDDVFGHGTWVASVALGGDPTHTGLATDARYINARVLNSGNGFPNDSPVRNGIGFAINEGADVLNLSLNFFAPLNSGNTQLDMMLDWAAFSRRISCALCVGNISTGDGSVVVRGPGSAYNGVTVGRTTFDYSRVHPDSATAFTSNHRMKPDVVAPGSLLTLANDDWEGAAPDWDSNLSGCSFATPHVAGMMAQQIDAGRRLGLNTDPLVVKATLMNSAAKIPDKAGNAWAPSLSVDGGGSISFTEPLDTDSGAGQIDGRILARQYLAGEKAPGLVAPIGWDFNTIAPSQSVDYAIEPFLAAGSPLTATLAWYRHIGRNDNGNGLVDGGDSFFLQQLFSNLELQLFRDGALVAASTSSADNVEHLHITIDRPAQYTLRVSGLSVFSSAEEYALAWIAIPGPEPGTHILAWLALLGLALRHRR